MLLNTDDPDSVIANLRRTQYKALRDMDIIKDWFVNKLDNAFTAIDHGVKEVIITCPSQLGNPTRAPTSRLNPLAHTGNKQSMGLEKARR